MPVFFSVSGLRGIVGRDLDGPLVRDFARAFGAFLGAGPVVFGRDARRSSPGLASAVADGLSAAGCDAFDLGIAPTPTVLYEVPLRRARGGIVVTASHNPAEWNGMKFVAARGSFLDPAEFDAFARFVKDGRFRSEAGGKQGAVASYPGAREDHLAAIASHPFIRSIERKPITVGIDAGNGAASDFAPDLMKRLDADVRELYCTPDGTTPRPPEPLEENLADLARFVRDHRLDVGFAFDPDGDRLACVDEKGTPIGEERTLALAVGFVLAREPGPVVINLSTSRVTEDVAKKSGAAVFRTPIGEANVVERMRMVGAVIGGEGNGGVIFPGINYGRDGLVASALITSRLREAGAPLSELVRRLPQYRMKKMKVTLESGFDARPLRDAFAGCSVDETDGIRFEGGDWWLHVRSSKTEPVVRIIAEARTDERVATLIADTLRLLNVPQ